RPGCLMERCQHRRRRDGSSAVLVGTVCVKSDRVLSPCCCCGAEE
ncbi:hypothetical protein AVEN_273180-1, partial [Araneus ventricosus]